MDAIIINWIVYNIIIKNQILAKQGTDSKFEANLKVLVPKSKQSLILIYPICVHMNAES